MERHLFDITIHFYYIFKYVYPELSIIINNRIFNLFCFFFEQTKLLTQYILNLGKYDQNYDIRDRTRFIRQLIVPNEKSGALSKYAKKIFLAPKPAPLLESPFKGITRCIAYSTLPTACQCAHSHVLQASL